MTSDLREKRLRALCCPDGHCKHHDVIGYDEPASCEVAELDRAKLAAHDAVLLAAGIPIDKLADGTYVAVPKGLCDLLSALDSPPVATSNEARKETIWKAKGGHVQIRR